VGQTIAITGGRGFIGRKVVAVHLALGDYVRVLARGTTDPSWGRDVEIVSCDLASPAPAELERFTRSADVLYHCAAEHQDALRMSAVNVEGTRKLLAAAAGNIGRWVQLSSLGVYGPRRSGVVREDAPPAPVGAYETTKLAADQLVIDACKRTGMPWAMLRPGIVFGRGMPNDSMRAFLRAIRGGRFAFIGPPGAVLPYVHVDDVITALVLCAKDNRAVGEVFNLSEDCKVEEFVFEAARLLAAAPPNMRLPEFPVRVAAKALSWIPGVSLTTARVDALTRRVSYPVDKVMETLEFRFATGWRNGLREMVAAL
jgi:nucleoside-diphosphate-sugar epimerase